MAQRAARNPSQSASRPKRKRPSQRAADHGDGGRRTSSVAGSTPRALRHERKRAEEALRESEERYRCLVELSPHPIAVHYDGKFVYANPTAAKLLGAANPEELVGMPVLDIVAPEYRETVGERVREVLEEGKSTELMEMKLVRLDGQVIDVEVAGTPVTYLGKPASQLVARDISERKQVEEALRRSEERFRSLFRAAFEGIAIHENGVILDANLAFEGMTGYPFSELIGKSIFSLLTEESRGLLLDKIRSGAGQPDRWEAIGLKKDGSTYDAEIIGRPYVYKGRVVRVLAARDITERKRAEEALRESEELHRLTLSSVSDAVFVTDDAGAFTFICPNVDVTFGYSFQEVAALGNIAELLGNDLFDPTDLETSGEIQNVERDIVDKSGRAHALLVNVKRVSIKGGTVLCTCRDITARKRAEEALHRSEEHFRSLIENASDIIVVLDARGTVRYESPSAERVLGYEPGYLVGRNVSELIHPDDVVDAANAIVASIEDPIPEATRQFRARHRDGSWRFLDAVSSVLDDGTGVPLIVVNSRDITERKRAEEALRESQERYRSIVETAQEGIWTIDADGNTTFVNAKLAEMLGYAVEEMNEAHLFNFMDKEGKAIAARNLERRQQGITEQHEFKFRRKDGYDMWALVSTNPIYDDEGKYAGALAMVADITERKRVEEALARQAEIDSALAELGEALIHPVSIEDISSLVLEAAKRLTGSAFGYVGHIDPHTGYLIASTMTTDIWDACEVPDKDTVFKTPTGLQGWVLENRKPLLTNAPSDDPRSVGTPQGHVPIHRFLSAPALLGKTTVGQVAVANSDRDYSEQDLLVVQRLATLYALAVQRKRMEAQLEEALGKVREGLEISVERRLKRRNVYGLTFRELTVLRMITAGQTDRGIATALGISHLTAQKHTSNILRKMEAASRTEAGARAIREGLVD